MKKVDRLKAYKRLEDELGRENQLTKAIEEFAELIKEITQVLGKGTISNLKNICGEIGDAKISLEQLERFYDPTGKAIEIEMHYKLSRLDLYYLNPAESLPDFNVNDTREDI